ncbi:hypothetical protein ORI89_00290 [Sphingobacterium sp. UT-1RO-CII-1]|uniref:DUF4097 family beta strand repeat-containing protein n=1 Tax=Sphingobacterium sp. UT-1RO-CII-1 TaxID=2995225 RepID=UPI00227A6B99|nr:DUF4097 family beta strand repeat-containing protein [Sphingobacterium sp. UT-1RO-CII-1]MCY4778069.1 hypothetical protein [Sphingobacterium sp. UT-1RO-CII-1]
MKKTLIALIFLITSTGLFAQELARKETFSLSAIKDLAVSTTGGYIQVNGAKQGEASVELWVQKNGIRFGNKGDLKKLLNEHFDIVIALQGGTLTASAKAKKGKTGNNPVSVSFVIIVPEKVNSNLKTSGGSITLNNLDGNSTFQTAGGSLTLNKLNGTINGLTSGGSITAAHLNGPATLKTSGGSITIKDSKGQLEARTSGGSINLNDIEGPMIVSTSGGSINGNDLAGSLQAKTSGGSVNVKMDKVVDLLDLSTSAGTINIRVPQAGYKVQLHGSGISLPNGSSFTGKQDKRSAEGTIGNGGAQIKANTSAGSVRLNFD